MSKMLVSSQEIFPGNSRSIGMVQFCYKLRSCLLQMETVATELRLGLGPLALTDRKDSVDLSFKKF